MGSHPPRFTTMVPTRLALLAAPFLLLIIIGASQAQPRTGRQQDEEAKEEMTTTTQASTTTTKATMVEETNEVIDPMEQCDKCRKAAYTYKKKFFCQKCVKEGHLKEADTVVNCGKCRKPRYRARNGDFCSEECPDISAGGLVDNSNNMVDKAEVEPTVVTTSVETDEAKELGVLGSIFKFLVEANTWGEVPASIPSAAEVEVEKEEDPDLKEDVEVEMER